MDQRPKTRHDARRRSILKLRWVTWWPAPYWEPRFEALSERPEVDLEVVFLAAASSNQRWQADPSDWRFRSVTLDPRPSASGYAGGRAGLGRFGRLLKGGRATTVIMPYGHPTYDIAALVARLTGIRYHLFVANTSEDARSGRRLAEIAKRVIYAGAAGYLATGPHQRRYAQRYARTDRPISVIGNPVDTETLRRQAERLAPEQDRIRRDRGWSDRFVIGFVGRLTPEKGLATLVDAAGTLTNHGLPVTIAFAGAGPLEQGLREQAERLGVSAVFLGFLDPAELGVLYTALDAFVLPSVSEAWGLVVNEAMEFGLPVVVSDRVGSRHLIQPGVSGYVTPTGDADALADILAGLAKDPALRARIGGKARGAVATQTAADWAERVVRHLDLATTASQGS